MFSKCNGLSRAYRRLILAALYPRKFPQFGRGMGERITINTTLRLNRRA